MVHVSRRAAVVSAQVAAALAAGAVAAPALRRLRRSSEHASRGTGSGASSSASAGTSDTIPAKSVSEPGDDGHVDDQTAVDDPDQVERGRAPMPVGNDGTSDGGANTGPGRGLTGDTDAGPSAMPDPGAKGIARAKARIHHRLTAAWAYTRGGFKPTVWVLLVLTIAPIAYG